MGPILKDSFERHLTNSLAQDQYTATQLGRYNSLAFAVRDQQLRRWPNTPHAYDKADAKRVYYLSLEFLLGRMLGNNLINLQRFDESAQAENIFIFGLKAEEVRAAKRAGYQPRYYYDNAAALKRVIDMIASDFFSGGKPGLFQPIVNSLLDEGDRCTVLRDFETYVTVNGKLPSLAYLDVKGWSRKRILNLAHMERFSSDRASGIRSRDLPGESGARQASLNGRPLQTSSVDCQIISTNLFQVERHLAPKGKDRAQKVSFWPLEA